MARAAAVSGFLMALVLASSSARAITPGQLDDFTDLTLQGWQPVQSVTTPGPDGPGDPFLYVLADASQSHGKIVVFNQAQWSGNYLSAGVRSISFHANNFGPSDLSLRLAIGDSLSPLQGGTWLVTSASRLLPSGSGWTAVSLSLTCADLVVVQGPASCAQVMSSVVTLRILSAAGISAQGDPLVGVLGLDKITAPVPVPVLPYADDAR